MPDKNLNISTTIRRVIRDELRGIYTASPCIVEDIDADNYRVEVSLKSDPEVFVDDVPILTPFGGNEYGLLFPVETEMEGLLLHSREPIADAVQERGHFEQTASRRHTLEAATFVGAWWLDEDELPDDWDEESLTLVMPTSDTLIIIDSEGDVLVEHDSGSKLRLDDEGVHIEPELYVDGIPFTEHTHSFDYDGGGLESSEQSGTTEKPDS